MKFDEIFSKHTGNVPTYVTCKNSHVKIIYVKVTASVLFIFEQPTYDIKLFRVSFVRCGRQNFTLLKMKFKCRNCVLKAYYINGLSK